MIGERYARAVEQWTLKRRKNVDGSKILSLIQHEFNDGCVYSAISVTLEALSRMKGKDLVISPVRLAGLYLKSKSTAPVGRKEGKVKKLIKILMEEGVMSETDISMFNKGWLREAEVRRCRVKDYRAYNLDKPRSLRAALYHLQRGPLIAVFRISENYSECFYSKHVYRYDPSRPVEIHGKLVTHAVSVVSFAIEEGVPVLECQNSHGVTFSRDGFLAVDICSIIELYSIRI